MKKKVLTMALACALSAACLFSATACGNTINDDEPSVEVTEEEWKAAFEKMKSVTSFTAKKVYDYDDRYIFDYEGKVQDSHKIEHRDEYYSAMENIAKIEISSKYNYDGEITEGSGICYEEKDGGQWYHTEFFGEEWRTFYEAYAVYVSPANLAKYYSYATIPETFESSLLSELYSSFTYDNERYIAKLYGYYDPDSSRQDEYRVEIKFNKDGYVSYFAQIEEYEFHIPTTDSTCIIKTSITYSNFGTTTVSIDPTAKKAIDDYKAANPILAQ